MEFEWDPAKRRTNLAKHGYDFLDVRSVFDGRPRWDFASPRGDEPRTVSIAMFGTDLIAVAWTARGDDVVRLISARRARRGEKSQYRQIHG